MDFSGLVVEDNGADNIIEIDGNANFKRSRIIVNGDNNVIKLGKTLSYTNFVVNIKGNNKLLEIQPSTKNINGLKFVSIRSDNQQFKIGNNFSCGGMEVQMNDGNEKCTIGADGLFSWGIKIRTSDGHSVVDLASNKAINLPKDVHIADRVWVGEDVSFLKGAEISSDSVVGSRAVVTKRFNQSNCVIAGFPAVVVKENIKWDRRKPSEYNDKEN
jgi:acetyltransferase-like isoleucine patch superfamily enzyme